MTMLTEEGFDRHPHRATRRADRLEYRLVTALALPVFLTIAIVARLAPRRMREKFLGASAGGSVFAEAKALADTSIPFAFMG